MCICHGQKKIKKNTAFIKALRSKAKIGNKINGRKKKQKGKKRPFLKYL